MNIKVWITIAGQTLEHVIYVPKEEHGDLEQAVDDKVADILSEEIIVEYSPVRGN